MTIETNNFMRILDNNLAELIAASIGFSSELTAYPATNAVNRFRSKQWRAKGNFTIDSSNSALYIQVAGNNTTVDLTAGNYNYSSVASHISSRLNTLSSGWTCSYDFSGGTFKFLISNAASVKLRLSQTANAAWDTLGFIGTTDETNTSFTADEQRNHTDEYLQFDLGYAGEVKAFMAIGTLDEVFSISSDGTIRLQANNVNSFSSPPLDIDLSGDLLSTGIYKFIDSIATDLRYRHWKFKIIDRKNPLGPEESIKISHIYLGDYTQITSRSIQSGFNKATEDPSVRSESEGGALYFDTKTKFSLIQNVGYAHLSKSDRLTLENLFDEKGTTTPFYVSIDPNLKISTQLDELTKYVVYDSSPNFSHVIFDKFNYSINFSEVI